MTLNEDVHNAQHHVQGFQKERVVLQRRLPSRNRLTRSTTQYIFINVNVCFLDNEVLDTVWKLSLKA